MATVRVSTEFGQLQLVVMRMAGRCTLDLAPDQLDPVLRRQLATSDWDMFDQDSVRRQQQVLIDLLRGRGVEVVLADNVEDGSAQHFPRDLGFVIDDLFIVARLNSTKRQTEFASLRPIVEQLSAVAFLDSGTIEGGDVMLWEDMVLVGRSEETSRSGIDALRYCLRRHGIERQVVEIDFATDGVVHLDDHFNVVAPGVAVINPMAFPAERMRWFEQRFDLIRVTVAEARAVAVNMLAIAPGVVVLSAAEDRLAGELRQRGITALPVDYSEVMRMPGGFRCTTLPLRRAG